MELSSSVVVATLRLKGTTLAQAGGTEIGGCAGACAKGAEVGCWTSIASHLSFGSNPV